MRIVLLLLWLGMSSVSMAADKLHFRDLYGRGGEFSEMAKQKQGQTIRVRGYMAPPIKAQAAFFVLTKMPMSYCPFCESEADWPADIMLVKTDDIIDVVPYNQPIYVTGQLEIGTQVDEETGFLSRVRLVHAEFETAK
ncbi:hypothetical protein [Marinomonas transparens]|uniref:DUF3299 domain-containing protein n=1 Tax=Marinomonas transparens TaxID=2795388 RepID=A0A934MXI8_9GAMM|nr:hypothetical protein [Marinomonas transparens]MBJ7539364.1 hypothetical protein [Marinomonas transparens]